MDFVIERGGKLVGVEVKNSEKIGDRDLAGLKELQAVAGPDFLGGVVLCNTPRVIAWDEGIYLVPINALWG